MNVLSVMIKPDGRTGVGYGFNAPTVEAAIAEVAKYAWQIDARERFRAVTIEVSCPCLKCDGAGNVARDRRRKFSTIFNCKPCPECKGTGIAEIAYYATQLFEGSAKP